MNTYITPEPIYANKTNKLVGASVTMMPIEAYAMPSSTYVPNDSHCFVVTKDRQMCWKNNGRCWNNEGDRIMVAKNNAYKEWLLEFCPPEDNDKCGITFGVNGVCHTYANRELLVGENEANVSKAEKDYVCVAIFGKYGFGLDELKTLLTASYKKVSRTLTFPNKALENVLARIDNTITDEMTAWYRLAIEYFGIPGSTFLRTDLIQKARKEFLPQIMQGREEIYVKYRKNREAFHTYSAKIGALYMNNINSFLEYMLNMKYISDMDKAAYEKNIKLFFKKIFGTLNQQENSVLQMGFMNEKLLVDYANLKSLQYLQTL